MEVATFRWRANPWPLSLAVFGFLALWSIVAWVLIFVHHVTIGPLGILVGLLFGPIHRRFFRYRLELGPDALTLFAGHRERWRVPWADLIEIRLSPADDGRRLILVTRSGERTLNLGGPAGHWDDLAALKERLRARGHAALR